MGTAGAYLSSSSTVTRAREHHYCLPFSGWLCEEVKVLERLAELSWTVGVAGFWAVVDLSWGEGKKLCSSKRRANKLKTV